MVTALNAGQPLPGVLVLLRSADGTEVARALTDSLGRYRLSAGNQGPFQLRAIRIGYRPVELRELVLSGPEAARRDLVLASVPLLLDTVRVSARSLCGIASHLGSSVSLLWEQARAAVHAAQATAARSLRITTRAYTRVLDPHSDSVRRHEQTVQTEVARRPWRSRSLDSLRRFGYVEDGGDEGTRYFAPGLEVLLAPEFTADHCFAVSERSSATLVALAFEPSRDRRRVPEVAGLIWLDRSTAELRRIEFRYVNLSREQEQHARGEMSFTRLPDGAWVIGRWFLRMPVLETQLRNEPGRIGVQRSEIVVTEVRITGGDVLTVMTGRDTLWRADAAVMAAASRDPSAAGESRAQVPSAVLAGVVRDDSTSAPLANAQVTVPALGRSVPTDSLGRFRLARLPAGAHDVSIQRLGYSPVVTRLVMTSDQQLEKEFRLRGVQRLDTVSVTAAPTLVDFEDHRRIGLGSFLTRADLEAQEGRRLSEVLSQLRGIQIMRGSHNSAWVTRGRGPLSMGTNCTKRQLTLEGTGSPSDAGCACFAQVYLDNQRLYGGAEGLVPDINRFAPGDIEAIEYYSGPASTPAKYSSLNSSCGVLVIHTRRK